MDDLKVLVVDDEKGMREGVARVLSSFALRMPEIENGDVLFRAVRGHPRRGRGTVARLSP